MALSYGLAERRGHANLGLGAYLSRVRSGEGLAPQFTAHVLPRAIVKSGASATFTPFGSPDLRL